MTKKRLFKLALPFAWLLPLAAHAATLGEAQVRSYLGQPLLLQVELVGVDAATIDEADVRIGRETDFDRLSMPYEHAFMGLQLNKRAVDGRWVVEVRSREAFPHPFVELPLVLHWRGNRLVKGVTALLDPPSYRPPQLASVQTRAASPAPGSTPGNAAANTAAADNSAGQQQYRVQAGDTLWPIAQRFRPRGVTTPQMMIGLLQQNPQAFGDGNINKLRGNAVLTIPTASQLPSAAAARDAVAQQTEDWRRGSRSAPVAAPAPRAAATPAAATATDSPSDAAQAPAATAAPAADAAEQQPQLAVLLPEGEADGSGEQLQREVLLTHEEVERTRIEQAQLRDELARMRQELEHMERLVTLKNEQITTLQSLVRSQKSGAEPPQAIAPQAEIAEVAAPQTAPAPAAGTRESDAAPASPLSVPTHIIDTDEARQASWWWWLLPVAVLALLVVLLKRRREERPADDVPLADLPDIRNAPPKPYTGTPATPDADADQAMGVEEIRPRRSAAPLAAAAVDDNLEQSESLLDESLSELTEMPSEPATSPQTQVDNPPRSLSMDEAEDLISEDDLAELAQQLSDDTDMESEFANLPESVLSEQIDHDLPELDSVLQPPVEQPESVPSNAPPQMDEDKHLLLEMARAYIELGDTKGAVAMLEEALESTEDPALRAQITEQLQKLH